MSEYEVLVVIASYMTLFITIVALIVQLLLVIISKEKDVKIKK